jgi:hypothetical protein
MLGSLSCSFTSISLLSNLLCVLSVMLGSLSCSFTSISLLSNVVSHVQYTPSPFGERGYNEHERLPNITLKTQIRLESKDIDVNEHERLQSDIWSQTSYRYPILWEAFLDPSDSYFLFADFVDFYTH